MMIVRVTVQLNMAGNGWCVCFRLFFCWHHVHDCMPRLQKLHATFLSDIYFCLKDNS